MSEEGRSTAPGKNKIISNVKFDLAQANQR